MGTLSTSRINTNIREHWEDHYSDDNSSSFHYWPMQYPRLNNKCFLFVGLNPSLKAKEKKAGEFVLKGPESLSCSTKRTKIISKDETNRGGPERSNKLYGYPLCQEIFRELNKGPKRFESWDYIDIFSNRILKASDLKEELDIESSQKEVSWPPNGSAAEQYKIFEDLLSSLEPKAVLVANAFASHILIQKMGLKDAEQGYDFLPKKVPIFFSSAISGGHLDVFSRRRLEDQITLVVKNR